MEAVELTGLAIRPLRSGGQTAKFDLVLNKKTAKALDLVIPPSVIGRATELIE
jgi:hypothetical protein